MHFILYILYLVYKYCIYIVYYVFYIILAFSLYLEKSEDYFKAENITQEPVRESVYYMEEDMYLEGNLLFITHKKIRTTNSTTTRTVWTGDEYILGFTQLNRTHLAIADRINDCIILLDRTVDSSTVLAGQCGSRGDVDGNASTARLSSPGPIIKGRRPDELLVTQSGNLRSVNINTGSVTTMVRGMRGAWYMAWYGDSLLIACGTYMAEVSWDSDNNATFVVLAGQEDRNGDVNGAFNESRFQFSTVITSLSTHTFLVRLYVYNGDPSWVPQLRLLDMERRLVLPVCLAKFCEVNHDIKQVSSLLRTKDALYVGQNGIITKLTG